MANSWFRMYAEFATDPKVQMMSEANQRRFIMLLCLRCSNGCVTLHDDEVAFQLRISNEDWAQTKAAFLSKNLITEDNSPTAWDKRQFVSDSSAERVSRHRAKKKQQCNVTVTPPDTDTDTDTEEDMSTPDGVEGVVKTSAQCPHQDIIDAYHELLPSCTPVKVWNETRKRMLRQRWRESEKRQSIAWWRKFFAYVGESDFLSGKTQAHGDRRPFVADLEWLVRPTNFAKVIDGKYHEGSR